MREILLRESKVGREKEHFWSVALNRANKIINIELSALGSIAGVGLQPMDVFRLALIKGASAIIMVHNHPSGNLSPSKADIEITNRLLKIGSYMGVQVLDHLIISESDYYSFVDDGLMFKIKHQKEYEIPALERDIPLNEEKVAALYATKMKENGLGSDKIALITGLSIEQIDTL